VDDDALARLAAKVDIAELIGRYCIAFDDQDWDTLATLWADDCSFLVDGAGPRGHREVVEFLRGCLPAGYRSRHMISPPVIDLAPDMLSARVRTDVVWLSQAFAVEIVARYDDQVVRSGERWLLAHRNELPIPFAPGRPAMSDAALSLSASTMNRASDQGLESP
jgi:uncharacterized protein (TIGR02246 family)